jgi:hypothetical protein
VILVVTDGLRWQEVFTGADSTILFGQPKAVNDTAETRHRFWYPTPDERRRALMPFLWNTIARQGALFGNRLRGSTVQVTNGMKVSYPGYNEMLTGKPNPEIRDNDFGRNPTPTVFEWLNGKPELRGHVEAFGTWETFDDIFNVDRADFPIHAGWRDPYRSPGNALDSLIDRMYRTSYREWHDVAWDALMQSVVVRAMRDRHPRALFVGYGETDEWAHAGRYDSVLKSTVMVDTYLAELWNLVQRIPEYRGTTTMIVTTDHGRGSRGREWRDHGEKINGAEDIWIAMIGPDVPALGEVQNGPRLTQSQIAATVASLLGQDYRVGVPGVASPIVPR